MDAVWIKLGKINSDTCSLLKLVTLPVALKRAATSVAPAMEGAAAAVAAGVVLVRLGYTARPHMIARKHIICCFDLSGSLVCSWSRFLNSLGIIMIWRACKASCLLLQEWQWPTTQTANYYNEPLRHESLSAEQRFICIRWPLWLSSTFFRLASPQMCGSVWRVQITWLRSSRSDLNNQQYCIVTLIG